ncbi:MAG: glycosyltransferase family 2 protein [Hyphomonadaceae bacterium]
MRAALHDTLSAAGSGERHLARLDNKTGSAAAKSRFDFLTAEFASDSSLQRQDGRFEAGRPWAIASYGSHRFKSGWWRLDAKGAFYPSEVELRLRSSADPLIVVGSGEGARIYLRSTESYDLSVLLAIWPRHQQFETLALRRLSMFEGAALVIVGAFRVLSRPNALSILTQLARRFLARQALGVRTAPKPPSSPPLVVEDAQSPSASLTSAWTATTRDAVTAVFREGDVLDPQAFEIVRAEFDLRPEIRAVFADLLELDRVTPRPEWDSVLAQSCPYIDGPVFIRGETGAGAWDNLTKIAATHGSGAISRISLPLARRPRAHMKPLPPPPAPELREEVRVSVIIPTKFQVELLRKNLTALTERTAYRNIEIIIVDNGCSDPAFVPMAASFSQRASVKCIQDLGAFNFSRLVNAGAAAATGEVLLLLNDDVEAIEPTWLHRMVSSALEPDVGAVGARLLYPDGSVQHAGVILGVGGIAGHMWKGTTPVEAQQNPYIVYPGSRLAVTGACLAVRTELYRKAGGFDEALAVALNDIDFCLRVRELGFRNIYRGDAVLTHHEGRSRGMDDRTVSKRTRLASETRYFLERWREVVGSDPYGSPAFDPTTEAGLAHAGLIKKIAQSSDVHSLGG